MSQSSRWYLIGVIPLSAPDPDYWLDRFAWVLADSEEEAKEIWTELRQGWLREDEKRYIKVYGTKDKVPDAWSNTRPIQYTERERLKDKLKDKELIEMAITAREFLEKAGYEINERMLSALTRYTDSDIDYAQFPDADVDVKEESLTFEKYLEMYYW